MAIKEVYFNEYCPKCKNWEKSEADDPCFDCLNQGWNEDSHKPICYKPKDEQLAFRTRSLIDELKGAKI